MIAIPGRKTTSLIAWPLCLVVVWPKNLVLGHMTTGAGDDIEKATELARRMVCEWGMSDQLGPMTFGKKEEQIFLGRDFTQTKDYSEKTALEIDTEVRRIIVDAYDRAKRLFREPGHSGQDGRGVA